MEDNNRKMMRLQWKAHKLAWNLSGGRLGRRVTGMPVLELVTIGRKSGEERQILISYVDDSGTPAIIGTNAGKDADPAWVLNLRANPNARARWDGKWRQVTAVELTGEDHQHVWNKALAANSGFQTYKMRLTRPVPIIRLITG
ncbi:MAG: nitroreductase/quinone reductase family protein [Acidimicrobiia bacterium]|nr:nitroreductase/quinone reductase family protein [Acidimicrobiia bacterium]